MSSPAAGAVARLTTAALAVLAAAIYLLRVGEPVLQKLMVAFAYLGVVVIADARAQETEGRWRRLAVPAAATVVAIFACWRYLDRPVAVLSLVASAAAIVAALRSRGATRILLTNAAVLFLLLAACEAALALWPSSIQQTLHIEPGHRLTKDVVPDPDLGFVMVHPALIDERREASGRLLFDVRYTLDDDGLRTTGANRRGRPVLLFGCSFAFAQGVDDVDSLAAVVEHASGDRLHLLNFAAIGYGAHQSLAMIESGRVDRVLRGDRPLAAVYVAIPDHVARAAGARPWDLSGPRYVARADGRVSRQGQFNTGLAGKLRELRGRSALYVAISSRRPPADEDISRYVAIVRAMDRQLRARYGVPLRVLFWDDPHNPQRRRLIPALRSVGVDVADVFQLAPELLQQPSRYYFDDDWHPNRAAHAVVGRALARLLAGSNTVTAIASR